MNSLDELLPPITPARSYADHEDRKPRDISALTALNQSSVRSMQDLGLGVVGLRWTGQAAATDVAGGRA